MTDWPTILRSTRDRLGLTQARLAELLSVTEQSVQNWEAGRSEPAHPGMVRLALDAIQTARKP